MKYKNIESYVKIHMRNQIEENSKIIVCISGGADSVCLFHVLYNIGFNLVCVHINHNLRGAESLRDEIFVKELCSNLNVKLITKSIIINKGKKTLEEAARDIRYEIFENVRKEENAHYIATAHNKNDNVETILLNFFRGTGLKGLRGIPCRRGFIIRPLINISRDEIESYIKLKNLCYIEDSTNKTDIYTRNKIRKIVKEYNLLRPLSTSLEIFTEEDNFINEQTEVFFEKCVTNNELNILEFKNLHIAIKRRIVKKLLDKWSIQGFSSIHINVFVDLANKPRGKKLDLPNNLVLLRKGDKIKMLKKQEDLP